MVKCYQLFGKSADAEIGDYKSRVFLSSAIKSVQFGVQWEKNDGL